MFRQLAQIMTGRAEVKRSRSALAGLPFLGRLMKKA
jgi:hypothetical protein